MRPNWVANFFQLGSKKGGALRHLLAHGKASVPRSLRYACERAHTLGQPYCTAGRKQGRARSEIACRDGKLVVTLHRPNAGTDARHHLQETHKQLNANTKTFHIMSKNIKAVAHELNTDRLSFVSSFWITHSRSQGTGTLLLLVRIPVIPRRLTNLCGAQRAVSHRQSAA